MNLTIMVDEATAASDLDHLDMYDDEIFVGDNLELLCNLEAGL